MQKVAIRKIMIVNAYFFMGMVSFQKFQNFFLENCIAIGLKK